MKTKLVCAIVTTFHPEQNFRSNIVSLLSQVALVIVVDDSGYEKAPINIVDSIEKNDIIYLVNKENIGIAASLNVGIEYAKKLGFEYMLTLDDDSVLSENYVNKLYSFLIENKHVALVNGDYGGYGGYGGYHIKTNPIERRVVITSGSLFSYTSFKEIGGFDELFFIDCVDFDFCIRLRNKGGKIISLPNVVFEHKIGESTHQSSTIKFLSTHNHSPFRIYYQTRNSIYFFKKHFFSHPLYCIFVLKTIFSLPLKIVLLDSNKGTKLKYYLIGMIDAMLGRWGKIRG
ncbi:glycosyltransferase [Aeromonas caviae]|uniref:glycosyltransferase n=1 Tax=Aeromonas caviae TaxID=648 RepID=UPI00403F6406